MRLLVALLVCASAGAAPELAAPIQLRANGKPIDVTGGHATPCIADVDGDGKRDLLVGQFLGSDQRTLFKPGVRLYRNRGTNKAPKLERFVYLTTAGGRAWVPSG